MIKHYSWLLLLSGFALWQVVLLTPQTPWFGLLSYTPYVLGVFVLFISIWFNRAQPLWLMFSIVLLNGVLDIFVPGQAQSLSSEILLPVLMVLLPLNVLVWLSLPEKGLYNVGMNITVGGLFLAQVVGVYWVLNTLPFELIAVISAPIIQSTQGVINLTFVGAISFLLTGFLLSLKLRRSQPVKVLNHTALVVLLLLALALNQFYQPGQLALLSSVAALMILLALIFDAHHIAYVDELTGLKSRRALFESFMGLGKQYAIAMVDIDHFKRFNDTYGHDVGDEVLKRVAHGLATVKGAKVYRYGGEEFTVVFKGKHVAMAEAEMNRLREALEQAPLEFMSQEEYVTTQVTMSVGIALAQSHLNAPQAVLKKADEALYLAKQSGRNLVVVDGMAPQKRRVSGATSLGAKTTAKAVTKTTPSVTEKAPAKSRAHSI
ncbi:GGDEF domain-containing protein [Thiomicrorhabdus aquaedulcis]|uniref:GGDEF domain-containing protein n=1 Tax=Thiomicrorhabdus aquaedulcis TaxID=2211106 RepID=UPI000FDC5626|nr:GGDEF domain-containing protein [Thiomicrorhabdus aquaedulcis]